MMTRDSAILRISKRGFDFFFVVLFLPVSIVFFGSNVFVCVCE